MNQQSVKGNTDFVLCFNYIEKFFKTLSENSRVSIIFLTDGVDNKNKKTLQKKRDDFKSFLQGQERKNNISSSIYCLGLSRMHDAVLLNFLAQSGSLMGNFIYIDTSAEDAEAQ